MRSLDPVEALFFAACRRGDGRITHLNASILQRLRARGKYKGHTEEGSELLSSLACDPFFLPNSFRVMLAYLLAPSPGDGADGDDALVFFARRFAASPPIV